MVAIMEQVAGEAFKILARQSASSITLQMPTRTGSPPAPTVTQPGNNNNGNNSNPGSSPLLFFVALGFGVVFTNLWIIVGVKYCFRYNARNRALRNGEDVDQINMDNVPARPHRRRKEKKLMTMDEVNERFPLTKYKNWVANRMNAGLPTAGGVTAPPSRAGSIRDVDGKTPSSPVDTKHSVNNTRPTSAASVVEAGPTPQPANISTEQKTLPKPVGDKENAASNNTESPSEDTTIPVAKRLTSTSIDDDDDDDDHIHTAVPPELLTNPGDSCAICIDTLEDDDDIRGLTCGHAFHAGCLDPWLTSRRACCPLCKADYYTPKPRPEGEQIDLTDRAARRREARMNMPQEPRSAWTNLRGAAGTFLPSRHENRTFGADAVHGNDDQRSRQERRVVAEGSGVGSGSNDNATASDAPAPAPSRFRNPFNSISMPAVLRLPGRNRPSQPAATDPSPSQLEAGTTAAR